MIYLDTSALLKLYILESGSKEVQTLVAAQSHPLPIWEAQQMEFLNALWLKVFWKELPRSDAERQIELFRARMRRGLYFFPEIERAELMTAFEQLSAKTALNGCRTMDVLHVACALHLRVDAFVTFDARQAALAREVGLRVPV